MRKPRELTADEREVPGWSPPLELILAQARAAAKETVEALMGWVTWEVMGHWLWGWERVDYSGHLDAYV